MKCVVIDEHNIHLAYQFLQKQKASIPYMYPATPEEFSESFLHEQIDGELMFDELFSYMYVSGTTCVALIQYGKPAWQWRYDGERLDHTNNGVLRQLYYEPFHAHLALQLIHKANVYFDMNKCIEVTAFDSAYGMRINGFNNKLYQHRREEMRLLRLMGYRVVDTSFFYTKSLKRMSGLELIVDEDGICFVAEEEKNNQQFFAIKKYDVEIGGVEVYYTAKRRVVYIEYIYLIEEFRGRGWSRQALRKLMQFFRELGFDRMEGDLDEYNSLGQRLYEGRHFGCMGKCFGLVRK